MASLLLVDNDARITDLTAWFLRRAGHEVRVAESYAAARELLAEGAPELLLADLELGTESGREELARLSAAGSLPPTLVVSGYLDAELTVELERIPEVQGTLAKPFDLEHLERAIATALERAGAEGDRAPTGPAAASADDDDDGWIEIVPLREERS